MEHGQDLRRLPERRGEVENPLEMTSYMERGVAFGRLWDEWIQKVVQCLVIMITDQHW